jgi:Uma2 family endonuclease
MTSTARKIEMTYEVPVSSAGWEIEDEAKVPQAGYQGAIARELIDVLASRALATGADWGVGGDFALRWDPERPKVGVDPDVYLVEPALPKGERERSIRTWEPGHSAPRVVVEIVSESTRDEDYWNKPPRYAASGVRELWVFDPLMLGPSGGDPLRLQLWRAGRRDQFRRVYAGDGPAFSEELQAWVVVTENGMRLRVADDELGANLWPTAAEKERAEKERERAGRTRAEDERDAALREVERLRALLSRGE